MNNWDAKLDKALTLLDNTDINDNQATLLTNWIVANVPVKFWQPVAHCLPKKARAKLYSKLIKRTN